MLLPRALEILIDGLETARFDRYTLDTTDERWPSLGPSPTPIIHVSARRTVSALLTLPTDEHTQCVEVRDIEYFACLLLPTLRPALPLQTRQAIDLGDLLSITLAAMARRKGRKGPYALLQAAARRAPGLAPSHPLDTLWYPVTPPISVSMAVACVALSHGLAPGVRRSLQHSTSNIPWRRACRLATRPHAEQVRLLGRADAPDTPRVMPPHEGCP